MSDMTFQAHMLACDWPECDQTADPDSREEDWLHTDDGRDYCPEHWHIDDQLDEPVPGPDPTPSMTAQRREEFIRVLSKYQGRRTYEQGTTA